MTRVSNVDQILLLLREQLQRSERGRGVQRGRVERGGRNEARPLDRVRALAALDTLGEDEVRRAVVRGLLAEELGEAVSNDATFQALVDRVLDIIGDSPEGVALLDRAVAQLRAG